MQPIEPDALPMMVIQRKVDGIIAVGPEISEDTLMAIQARRLPTVLVANCIDENPFSSVVADDVGGVEMAVTYLIGLSHKRIGFIIGNIADYSMAHRLSGYSRAH
jgi:LacI family transcriptional regulator